jgi:hypothetical protein
MLSQDSDTRQRRKLIRAERKQFCPACFRVPLGPLAWVLLGLIDAFAVFASLWNE